LKIILLLSFINTKIYAMLHIFFAVVAVENLAGVATGRGRGVGSWKFI
jgi:hypothetical protein